MTEQHQGNLAHAFIASRLRMPLFGLKDFWGSPPSMVKGTVITAGGISCWPNEI